jgi:uncharacterized membrane protein YcaP (DUF421 family)
MTLAAIAVRAIVAYVFLLLLVRLAGKRTIWHGTPMDFVVALILGDMVDDLLWAEVAASEFIVATSTLFLAHLMLSTCIFRNPFLCRWVDGIATPLLRDGEPAVVGLRRERISELKLLALLRQEGESDLRELERVEMEVSGELSMRKHDWARQPQKTERHSLSPL